MGCVENQYVIVVVKLLSQIFELLPQKGEN